MIDRVQLAAAKIAFLGEATEAAAFRLCGVRTWAPPVGRETAALEAALTHAALVLVSAPVARRLPAAILEAAFQRSAPLVLIIPELDGNALEIDPVVRVRRQLSLQMESDQPSTSFGPGHVQASAR